jgi:protein ImuB
MLWLALYFPRLSIELVEQAFLSEAPRPAKPAPPDEAQAEPRPMPPLAISNTTHILSSNSTASALGVQPGIKRATALALAPDLKLFTQDQHREQQALDTIALTVLQFTPNVSMQYEVSLEAALGLKAPSSQDQNTRPAGLLLELEASLLLFGGRERLLAKIQASLHEPANPIELIDQTESVNQTKPLNQTQSASQTTDSAPFTLRLALAPYPSSAWLLALANFSQGKGETKHRALITAEHDGELNARLASLPLSLLKSSRPHLNVLETIGARSIKDLVQLPRAGLARRFGKALLTELDQALGKTPELRQFYEAPLEFNQKLELLCDVENAQALLFAAQRLMQQLCQWLALRHAAVSQLELLAEHDDRAPTRFEIRLTEPSRDLSRLVSLLRERLNVSQLKAPAHTLILNCQEIVALTPPTQDLFPLPQTARESLARLVERLQVRLGREQVQQVLIAEDHRPEDAYALRPLEDVAVMTKKASTVKTANAALTYALGSQGHTALNSPGSAMRDKTHGLTSMPLLTALPGLPRPLWFFSKPISINERQNRPFYQTQLNLLAGPERIESGWWDNHLVQRDYFIAEDEHNNLYWLYRQRFPTPGWFIQGRFG